MLLYEFADTTALAVKKFAKFAAARLGLGKIPQITLVKDSEYSAEKHTFGHYDRDTDAIVVQVQGRQIVDVLRTVAHELVHAAQDERGELNDYSGEDGSPPENIANAIAGVLMREYTRAHPELFSQEIMEVADKRETSNVRTYMAKVKLQQMGFKQIVDVTVNATNQPNALRHLRAIYGKNNVVGNPREVGKDRR